MNYLIEICVIIVLLINIVNCCFTTNDPCYCELHRIKYECTTNVTVIRDYLYPSIPIEMDLKQSDIIFRHFPRVPPGPVLRKFKNLTELSIDYLEANKLEQFVYDGLDNLLELSIMYSNISIVEANAFYGLTNLIKLDMRFNKFTEFPNGTFVALHKLQSLDLRGNPLKKFQQHLFGINLNNFLLEENYYSLDTENMECDCDHLWVIEFGKKTKSRYITIFLNYNKCYLAWKKNGILDLDEGKRCAKLNLINRNISTTTLIPSTSTTTAKTTTLITPTTPTTTTSSTRTPPTSIPLENLFRIFPLLNNTSNTKITINIPSMHNFFIFNHVQSSRKEPKTDKIHVEYKKI